MILGNCSSTLQQDNVVSCNLKIKKVVKILGVHFTYDFRLKQKLNVDELISSTQQKLQIWRWRDLMIIGRIQIEDGGLKAPHLDSIIDSDNPLLQKVGKRSTEQSEKNCTALS